jgi:hypothetical protein
MQRRFDLLVIGFTLTIAPLVHAQDLGVARPGYSANPNTPTASPGAQMLADQATANRPSYDAVTHTITMPNGVRISPSSAQSNSNAAAAVRSLSGSQSVDMPTAAENMSANQPGFGGSTEPNRGEWRPTPGRAQLVLSPDVYVITDQPIAQVDVALIGGYGPVRVDYIVQASNLRNHTDYEAVSGTLYWQPGQAGLKHFDIPLNQPSIDSSGVTKGEIDFQIEDAAGAHIVGPSTGRVLIEKAKSPSLRVGACEIGGVRGCRGWIPAQALPQTGSVH